MDAHTRDGEATVQFDFTLGLPIFCRDLAGREHSVTQLRVKAKAVRRTSLIPIQSLSWKGMAAAFGRAETVLGKTVVTVIEQGPGKIAARVIADGRELDVHPRDHLDDKKEPLAPRASDGSTTTR
jgi:hypothetical protein